MTRYLEVSDDAVALLVRGVAEVAGGYIVAVGFAQRLGDADDVVPEARPDDGLAIVLFHDLEESLHAV